MADTPERERERGRAPAPGAKFRGDGTPPGKSRMNARGKHFPVCFVAEKIRVHGQADGKIC